MDFSPGITHTACHSERRAQHAAEESRRCPPRHNSLPISAAAVGTNLLCSHHLNPHGATMRTRFLVLASFLIVSLPTFAAQPCQRIHGRAILYTGDGQLRIWHIGTHHTFRPDERLDSSDDFEPSWDKVLHLLSGGQKGPEAFDDRALFADFVVCPTRPYREGASQTAIVTRIYHPKIVSRGHDGETPR